MMKFTNAEKDAVTKAFNRIQDALKKNGYKLPKIDELIIIKSGMKEEFGANGYTLANQIYLSASLLSSAVSYADEVNGLDNILCHELFHCLTRAYPSFKKEMYRVIGFTVRETPFAIV